MEQFSLIAEISFPLFGLMVMGFFAGKLFKNEQSLDWLNIFVLYFALPPLFFRLVSSTPFDELANWGFIATASFATYCAFALTFAVGVFFTKGDMAKSTIQAALGSYANIGYLGPGITLAVFGTAAAAPTVLVVTFDNMLMFSLVPLTMAFCGVGGQSIFKVLAKVSIKIVTHPFIVSSLIGIAFAYYGLQTPKPVDKLLSLLSNAAAPCALFAIGITVAQRPVKKVPSELPAIMLCKLVLHPFLVWGFLNLVGGFEPIWIYTAVLLAALPPAANVFVMAQQYDVYVERASSTILFTTAVSIVTVTTLIYFIKT